MTEEELKAIEYTKSILKFPKLYASTEIDGNFLRGIDKEKINTLLNLIEKQQEKIDETKEEQYFLIHKITSKIDYFDYEYKRAKRQGDNERADFYCELSKNFKKLLEE